MQSVRATAAHTNSTHTGAPGAPITERADHDIGLIMATTVSRKSGAVQDKLIGCEGL